MTAQDAGRRRFWCGYCRKEIIKARNGEWYHIRNSSTSCNPQAGNRNRAFPAGMPARKPKPRD